MTNLILTICKQNDYNRKISPSLALWLGPPHSSYFYRRATYEEWKKYCPNGEIEAAEAVKNPDARIYQDAILEPNDPEHFVLAVKAGSTANIAYLEHLSTPEEGLKIAFKARNANSIKYFFEKLNSDTVFEIFISIPFKKLNSNEILLMIQRFPTSALADFLGSICSQHYQFEIGKYDREVLTFALEKSHNLTRLQMRKLEDLLLKFEIKK
jgi:hypothetical protein